MNDDRLEKSLAFLAWRHIAGAILDVYRQNQAQEATGGIKASADLWSIREDLRQEVHRRATVFWAKRAGEIPQEFPYNSNFTARMYFRFRKRNQEEVQDFAREIDGPHHLAAQR
jgi:hypothetical protein